MNESRVMQHRTKSGLPAGWLATALGGVIGTLVIGAAGMALSTAYVDSYQSDGFEGLGTMIAGTVLAGFLGTILGAAAALKIFRHSRPAASGTTFAVLGVVVMLILGSVGQFIIPQELHDNIGALLLFTISPCLAAIVARAIFTRA